MYQRKTKDIYILLGNYGYGWEEVLAEETKKEARERLKEYRENDPQHSYKLTKKRVKL